jgi:hypothetical protein
MSRNSSLLHGCHDENVTDGEAQEVRVECINRRLSQSKWFQSIIVCGKNEKLYGSVRINNVWNVVSSEFLVNLVGLCR